MPQFALSRVRLAQNDAEPEVQMVFDPPHEVVHAPETHAWPAVQVTPHAPQLVGSVCRFEHAPPTPASAPHSD